MPDNLPRTLRLLATILEQPNASDWLELCEDFFKPSRIYVSPSKIKSLIIKGAAFERAEQKAAQDMRTED